MKRISIIILIVFSVYGECAAQNPEGMINFLIQLDDSLIVLSPEKDFSNSTNQYSVLKDESTNLSVASTLAMIDKITHDTITEVYPYLSEQERWMYKSWMDNRSDKVRRHYNELQTWSGLHIYSLHITYKKETMVVNFDNPGTLNIYVKIIFKPGQYSFGIDDLINGDNEVIKNKLFD